MTSLTDDHQIEVNRGLLVGGAILMSIGAVVGAAGAVMTSIAVIGAARSWVRQWDEPPSVIARRRLAQAKIAAAAGAQSWREQTAQPPTQHTDVDAMG